MKIYVSTLIIILGMLLSISGAFVLDSSIIESENEMVEGQLIFSNDVGVIGTGDPNTLNDQPRSVALVDPGKARLGIWLTIIGILIPGILSIIEKQTIKKIRQEKS